MPLCDRVPPFLAGADDKDSQVGTRILRRAP